MYVCSAKGIWKLQKKFVFLLQLTKMYRNKVLNFRVIFSCGSCSKIVWKRKISVQPVPKNCFRTYLEAEKVMFIVFEWKELGVYDVRYNNVRQSSHKKSCPEREEVERKKERTELKKVCFLWWQRQSLWEIPKPRSMTCFDGSPTFYGLHK